MLQPQILTFPPSSSSHGILGTQLSLAAGRAWASFKPLLPSFPGLWAQPPAPSLSTPGSGQQCLCPSAGVEPGVPSKPCLPVPRHGHQHEWTLGPCKSLREGWLHGGPRNHPLFPNQGPRDGSHVEGAARGQNWVCLGGSGEVRSCGSEQGQP